MGAFWRTLVGDSQLRWIGPEKGVIHLATAAVVNAVWDLFAKTAGKPLWKLVVDMTPEEIVALVDFRYITDAVGPEKALAIRALARRRPARAGWSATAAGLHDLRGLARLRRRQIGGSAARRWPTAGRGSR
jgi:L-fuconate dehydratase